LPSDEKLIGGSIAINQFRNAIYELVLVLRNEKNYNNEQILTTLKKMGRNIAENYFKFWEPKGKELSIILKEIYEFIFYKKVKVNLQNKTIQVTQKNCPFCKYERHDVGIAGCNLILGVIEKYCEDNQLNNLDGKVLSSKTFGNKKCIHQYTLRGS
jgi:predicted ArsR family transcriptional regulator